MCTHGRWVRNPYSHENIYVKCGKCHTCQLEKSASRFSRIMSHEANPDGYFRIFVTLNYSNQSLPYILMDEVERSPYSFGVYRHSRFRYVRARHGLTRLKRESGRFLIARVTPNSSDINSRCMQDYSGLQLPSHWKFERRAVGIALSSDFAGFLSRLKKRLFRTYHLNIYEHGLSYYKVQEYGPTTRRPHFHAILYFPKEWSCHYYKLRRAIIASWPFCSVRQISENVGIASSGQQYVSSYTCRPSDYPRFFEVRSISQKSSFSRGFGFGRLAFSPASIMAAFERRDFTYTYSVVREGKTVPVVSPIPKYVITRYVPYIKGLVHLDSSALSRCLSSYNSFRRSAFQMGMNLDEVPVYWNRILRASSLLSMSLYDYAFFYDAFSRAYASFQEHQFLMSSLNEQPFERYDNFSEVYAHVQQNGVLYSDVYPCDLFVIPFHELSFVSDPNKFTRNIIKDSAYEIKFDEYEKKAKFNSYIASLRVDYITYETKTLNYAINKEKTFSRCAFASSWT